MSIKVESTTDSAEAILAAQGGAVEPKVEAKADEQQSAPEETPAEALENSDAQDESEELDETQESEEQSEEQPKKKNKLQARMSKLTKQREEARKEADYWKNVALEKSQQKPQENQPAAEVKPDAKARPKAEDFEKHEDYVEALADWKVEERLAKKEQETKQRAIETEQKTKLGTFLEKRESFAKDHDDFFERMADIQNIPMSITVNESLLESENGPELLYELASDPENYKRICSLPAIQAAREIGKFEAKLQKAQEPKAEIKTTKAPKPPQPVNSGKAMSTKSLAEMDYQDYKRAREQGKTA
jgi:hypothetical protein